MTFEKSLKFPGFRTSFVIFPSDKIARQSNFVFSTSWNPKRLKFQVHFSSTVEDTPKYPQFPSTRSWFLSRNRHHLLRFAKIHLVLQLIYTKISRTFSMSILVLLMVWVPNQSWAVEIRIHTYANRRLLVTKRKIRLDQDVDDPEFTCRFCDPSVPLSYVSFPKSEQKSGQWNVWNDHLFRS